MANIRPKDLPSEANPSASDVVIIDGLTTRQTTLDKAVNAGRPLASQAEAEAGAEATKSMTPLTTRQAIVSYGENFATSAQGAKADTALQPAAIGTTVQAYSARLKSLADATDGTTGQVVGRAADGKLQFQNAGAGDVLAINNGSDFTDKPQVLVNIGALSNSAGAVGTTNIANVAVTTSKLADTAVTTPKITDGAITAPKVADGAIIEAKVADGAISDAKLKPLAKVYYAAFGAFAKKADISAATIDAAVDRIAALGYANEGDTDGDPIEYLRVGSEPSCHARLKNQSADGAWWKVQRPHAGLPLKWSGAKWDVLTGGNTDDSEALQACMDFGQGKILLPAGVGRVNSNLKIGGDGVYLSGHGILATSIFFYGSTFLQNSVAVPATTADRRYYFTAKDFSVYRKGAFAGSRCFDLDSFVHMKLERIQADFFEYAFLLKSAVPGYSVYNELDHLIANVCRFGFYVDGSQSNANILRQCRHNGLDKKINPTTGLADPSGVNVFGFILRNSNGCDFDAPLVDWATTGIYLTETVADSTFYNSIDAPRIEDVTDAIVIDPGVDVTAIEGGGATTVSGTKLIDNGTGTVKLGW